MPDKIFIIFLIYGEKFKDQGLLKLSDIVSRMFPSLEANFIVVDNALPMEYKKNENGVLTIGGDNSLWEFSGWDRGIRYLDSHFDNKTKSLILFANDTFYRRTYKDGVDFLDVFDAPIIEKKDLMNSAIGYLDDFPKEVSLNGIKYKSWIRSNIFIIPYHIAIKLHPLSLAFDDSKVFSDVPNEFWANDDFISNNWKAYISSWMFGKVDNNYPEYRLKWLKARPVNDENYEFFKTKAICILSEHYLSARLLDMNVPVIDTNIFEKKINRHTDAYYS